MNNPFITIIVILAVCVLAYGAVSYIQFNKQREKLLKVQNELKAGDRVILNSGFIVYIVSLSTKEAIVSFDRQGKQTAAVNRLSINSILR